MKTQKTLTAGSANTNRVRIIDNLRTFAMLHVILIHTLFWMDTLYIYVDSFYRSFLLFEMPLFFLVTGMTSNLRGRPEISIRNYLKRFQRILFPYWIYALFATNLVLLTVEPGRIESHFWFFFNWLIPTGRQYTNLNCLTWVIWFVPVYLLVILFLPLLVRHFRYAQSKLVQLLPIPVLFCVAALFTPYGGYKGQFDFIYFAQSVSFYLAWSYIGCLYLEFLHNKQKNILVVMAFVGIAVVSGFFSYLSMRLLDLPTTLSSNKFPPNTAFIFYSIAVMAILYIAFNYIDKFIAWLLSIPVCGWIINQYRTHTLTIMLYQPLAFLAIDQVRNLPTIKTHIDSGGIAEFCFIYPLAVIACAVLAWIFGHIEEVKVIK